MFYFLAFITGMFIVTNIIFNGNLNTRMGYEQTTLFNFISGLIVATLTYLIFDFGRGIDFLSVPFHLYLGGLFGVAVVIIGSTIVTKISAAYTTVLVFVSQLFTGIVFDFFRFGRLEWGDVIGGLIIISGIIFNLYCDKEEELVANSL